MRLSQARFIKASPFFWAVSVAIAVQLFAPKIWWHPDCNIAEPFNQTPAAGLPFPYAQHSVATSDIFYMPHVLVLNLIILTGVALPLTVLLIRRWERAQRAQKIQAVASVLLFSVLLVPFVGTLLILEPTESIASSTESYFDYRPVISGFKTTPGSQCVK